MSQPAPSTAPRHSNEAETAPHESSPPLTDSPWFWMAAFAFAGLVWLAAFGPKYAMRQEIIERRFEARQEVARRRASGELRESSGPETVAVPLDAEPTGADSEPPAHTLRVSLEPLVLLLAVSLEAALAMLLLARQKGPSQ